MIRKVWKFEIVCYEYTHRKLVRSETGSSTENVPSDFQEWLCIKVGTKLLNCTDTSFCRLGEKISKFIKDSTTKTFK